MNLGYADSDEINLSNKVPLRFFLCPGLLSEFCVKKREQGKERQELEKEG